MPRYSHRGLKNMEKSFLSLAPAPFDAELFAGKRGKYPGAFSRSENRMRMGEQGRRRRRRRQRGTQKALCVYLLVRLYFRVNNLFPESATQKYIVNFLRFCFLCRFARSLCLSRANRRISSFVRPH